MNPKEWLVINGRRLRLASQKADLLEEIKEVFHLIEDQLTRSVGKLNPKEVLRVS